MVNYLRAIESQTSMVGHKWGKRERAASSINAKLECKICKLCVA